MYVDIYGCTYMYVCMYVNTYTYIQDGRRDGGLGGRGLKEGGYIYMCVYRYIWMYIYVCMYVCEYVYIYTGWST